jgi:hypothetical protein
METFIMSEFDWCCDGESKRSVLIAPWFGKLGVWFDVSKPEYSNGLGQSIPEPPHRIVEWSNERPRLARDLLIESLNAKQDTPVRVDSYGVGC